MLPNPCMALMFLTTVCFLPMAALPFARQALITMGSISGVRPTATERANRKDSSQSPLVSPPAMNTTGTSTAMKRISTQAMELAPRSKPFLSWDSAVENPPYTVSFPTASTMPSPLPPVTEEPMKARLQ